MASKTPLTFDFTSDIAPVQAEGTVAGRRFYFRARGQRWSFVVANRAELDPAELDEADIARGYGWIREGHVPDGPFAASYLSRASAVAIIRECADAYLDDLNSRDDG